MGTLNVVAIVQARLGSTRLPGKTLRPIADRPMLDWVVRRLQRCRRLDHIAIATTTRLGDEPLVEYCRAQGWAVICGPEDDVLSRYLIAARQCRADAIVRVTADCPFIDPDVVDAVVDLWQTGAYDYCCNFWPARHFPRGLDCEVFHRSALVRAAQLAGANPRYREHVTVGIYENPTRFRLGGLVHDVDLSHHRWTVDTEDDLRLANAIAQWFDRDDFSWRQVLEAVAQNPHWCSINAAIQQKVA